MCEKGLASERQIDREGDEIDKRRERERYTFQYAAGENSQLIYVPINC